MSKQTPSSKSLSFSLLSPIRFSTILLFFLLLSYFIFGIFSRGPINTHAVTTGTDSNGQTYWDFTYNGTDGTDGSAQNFTIPANGLYKIELWGADGGDFKHNNGTTYSSANGGYVSGEATFMQNENLFIYIGGAGKDGTGSPTAPANAGGYNGGASGGNGRSIYAGAGGGGGATDIRLIGNSWDDIVSLRSRLMVAGASGASSDLGPSCVDGSKFLSFGGGLEGGYNACDSSKATKDRATQTSPSGYFGNGMTGKNSPSCYSGDCEGSGGGGGGYWGGYTDSSSGIDTTTHGGGGSSYISGHTGAVAVVSSSSTSPRTGTGGAACSTGTSDNLCSIHYSGLSFESTTMIDGAGYKWTNTKGSLESMPKPSGGYYASGTGHTGNGYARITQLSTEPELSVVWDNDTISFGSKPGLTSQEYVSTTTANISGATYGFTSSIDSSSDTCLRHSSITSQEDPLNPTPTNCTNTTTNYKIPLINTISPTDSNNSTATLTLTSKATTSASNVAGEYTGSVVVTILAKDPPKHPLSTTTMQAFTTTDCDVMANYDTATGQILANTSTNLAVTDLRDTNTVYLTDSRNSQLYRIRKMQDGKCWMIDNLKIYNKTLTSTDSDIESGTFVLPATLNTAASTVDSVARIDNPSSSSASDGGTYCNTTVYIAYPNTTTGCGYLYNWFAATAGKGTPSLVNTTVADSVCPKNWNLPTGNSGGQFDTLNGAVSLIAGGGQSWQGVYAGYLWRWLDVQGVYSIYWSSTASSEATKANYLTIDSTTARPTLPDLKQIGSAVRCIL